MMLALSRELAIQAVSSTKARWLTYVLSAGDVCVLVIAVEVLPGDSMANLVVALVLPTATRRES